METPRVFLGHIFGYSILFGFCIFLTMGTPVGGEDGISKDNNMTMPSTAAPDHVVSALREGHAPSPLPSAATDSSPTISVHKGLDSTANVSPQHHPSPAAATLASKREETAAEALLPSTTVPLSTPERISDDPESASYTQNPAVGAVADTTKAPLPTVVKVKLWPGAPTAVSTIWSTAGVTLSETTRQMGKEAEVSAATPWQHVPGYHETTSDGIHVRGATHTKGPESGSSEPRSSGKRHTGIILAVIALVLILLVISVFLLYRHQRRSGSTNFNAAGWAGQVALPDDSGLDRDLEQGATAGPAGEGEARRHTLVTFFGKRQSRLPSVALEDISGKGEQGECQQLLDGDAGTDAGEANGKLADPAI